MPAFVVGRGVELAALSDFLAGISDGASALVLEGEAGMGKTTLWRAGVAAAAESGIRVLSTLAAESETALSFTGIGDLLDPVLDEALGPLPAAQRRALSRALILDDDQGPAPEPHAVGVALLNAIRALGGERPLLLAVDDVQWLDPASSGALGFAARRVADEQVGVLLSRRVPFESPMLDEIRRSLPAERFHEIEIGPLELAALHQVVHAHLGVALPRPLLAEVHQASGGNPFYALEIVRTLTRSGITVEAGRPLPVPDSLHGLVHERLRSLAPESRDFLIAAAAHAHPTISITEAASGVGREIGLLPALDARIVEIDGDRIRFTHPLLAAGALEIADPERRVRIHARLAGLLEDPEARAWQLAASVDEPDESVATVIEDAADRARRRGAPRPAALLLDCAEQLTPALNRDDAVRRAVQAAYLHFEAGDSRRAEAKLREVIAPLPPGPLRAKALVVLARVRSFHAQAEAVQLFLQAVDEAKDEHEILSVAHEGVAACLFRLRERLGEAVEHAELAAALALELGDEVLAAEALGSQLLAETMLGRQTAHKTLARTLALHEAARDNLVLWQPLVSAAVYWALTDSLERARNAVVEMLQRSRDLGDESSPPYVLVLLSQVELVRGELESALGQALAGQEAAEQSGQQTVVAYHIALEGLVEAHRGRVERARSASLQALERVQETGGRPAELVARAALGHLELALGAPDATVAHLEPPVAFIRRERIVEPGAIRFVIDQVEALIELGRLDDATELLDWYEGNAQRLERISALANCARCRGLLAAQSGDLEAAIAAFEAAIAWHAQVELPLDKGRTLLAFGAAQRRAKRRREARQTLEEALGIFERTGAALWAERARAELKRISGRAASPGELTPAEQRVAALVATGKTNREVASALYLSDRTVEGHLARIFGKLGIRHRTEIAVALASRQTQGIAASNTGDSPVSAGPSAP